MPEKHYRCLLNYVLQVLVNKSVNMGKHQQPDEILVDLKFSTDHIISIFTAFNKGTVLFLMHLSFIHIKYIVMEVHKSGRPCYFASIPTIS